MKNALMIIIGLGFVVLSLFIVIVEPEAWPMALTAGLFFLAVAVVGVIEAGGDRLRHSTKSRLMGAISMVMGAGCGALAWTSWNHHGVFDRAPWWFNVGIGLFGLLFFGGGGLLLLIRGGRPFGAPKQ